MGQSRALQKLKQLMNQVPVEFHCVHGFVKEESINSIVLIPKPVTYDQGLINELTGTPTADNITKITGTLEEVVEQLAEFLNKLKSENKENS